MGARSKTSGTCLALALGATLVTSCVGTTSIDPGADESKQGDAGPGRSPSSTSPPNPDAVEPTPDSSDGEPAPNPNPNPSGNPEPEPQPEPALPTTPSPAPTPSPNSTADDAGTPSPSAPDESDAVDASTEPSPPETPEPPAAVDFFGDSRCSDEFLFCDDFEDGLDGDRWETRGPAPNVDDSSAARGEQSLHFHTEGNGLSMITLRDLFPIENNRYYARVFVRFASMPTEPMWAHWSISGAEGSGTDAEIRMGGQYDGQSNRFGVGSDHGPTGDWTRLDEDPAGNPEAVPVNEWVCLEWLNDGQSHEVQVWWDDVEHPSLYASSTDHGGSDSEYLLPEFESVWFGWWLYQADPVPDEYDVWLDEIVIDDEPIGCTR